MANTKYSTYSYADALQDANICILIRTSGRDNPEKQGQVCKIFCNGKSPKPRKIAGANPEFSKEKILTLRYLKAKLELSKFRYNAV